MKFNSASHKTINQILIRLTKSTTKLKLLNPSIPVGSTSLPFRYWLLSHLDNWVALALPNLQEKTWQLRLADCLVAVLHGINIDSYCTWFSYVDCIPYTSWHCRNGETSYKDSTDVERAAGQDGLTTSDRI
ncbi:Rhomboid-like protein [Arachis hypogaea]|nr:Rhomboid-like protein [Arachis hypogaea]